MNIGDKIKDLRIEKRISQTQLAKALGLAQNTLSQYENNVAKPSLDTLVLIAKFFTVSTDYLLGLEE